MYRQFFVCLFLFSFTLAQPGGYYGACSAMAITGLGSNITFITTSNIGAEIATTYCTTLSTASGTVWFSLKMPVGTLFSVASCSGQTEIGTILSLYRGDCHNPICIDYDYSYVCLINGIGYQAGHLEWESDGREYLIGVSGYGMQTGMIGLTLSAGPPTEH